MPGPIIPGGRSMKEPTNPEQPARSRKSPTNEGAGGRALEKSLARPRVWALALLVCVVACASPTTKTSDTPIASGEPSPRFAPGGPEAEEFGASIGYPEGNPATFRGTQWQVGSFSHLDEIFRGRLIHKASRPSRLVRVAEPPITWTLRGVDLTLDDYLARNPTTGLLIVRGDEILVERYQYGRTDRHRFTSWSMAKTVTAMLIGIAIDEGRIRSVDDLAAAYVPALDGTEYGRTSLRHLLQMSSGVRFNEEASPGFVTDDLIQFVLDTYMRVGPGGVGAVTSFNDRERPAGTKFSYSSVETQVLGLVLTRAIGRPVAEYLEQKIWQPIGAEADATFASDPEGAKMNPPVLRAPNGVMQDGAEFHGAGKPYYDPAQITVPTLLVLGEWDRDTPPYMAQTLFPLLVNAPGKRFIMLAEGTHTIMMEKNRVELFRAVQGFLDEAGGS